jgi:hypothetical protein
VSYNAQPDTRLTTGKLRQAQELIDKGGAMGRKKKNITFKLGPSQYRRVGPVKLLQVWRLEIWNIAGKIRAAWIDTNR